MLTVWEALFAGLAAGFCLVAANSLKAPAHNRGLFWEILQVSLLRLRNNDT